MVDASLPSHIRRPRPLTSWRSSPNDPRRIDDGSFFVRDDETEIEVVDVTIGLEDDAVSSSLFVSSS